MDSSKYLLSSPIPFNRIAVRFTINIGTIVLNDFAYIQARMFDENDNYVDAKTFVLDGQDYQDWTNDEYLIEWTRQKLAQ